MGLIEWLDKITFGEELLNRWAKERAEGEFLTKGKFLNPEETRREQELKQELNFIKEFYKLGNRNLFQVEELPKIFKEAIIARCGSLEREKLKNYLGYDKYFYSFSADSPFKEYVKGRIPLFSKNFGWEFFGGKRIEQGGFLYVENNEGEFRLKTYQDKFTISVGI